MTTALIALAIVLGCVFCGWLLRTWNPPKCRKCIESAKIKESATTDQVSFISEEGVPATLSPELGLTYAERPSFADPLTDLPNMSESREGDLNGSGIYTNRQLAQFASPAPLIARFPDWKANDDEIGASLLEARKRWAGSQASVEAEEKIDLLPSSPIAPDTTATNHAEGSSEPAEWNWLLDRDEVGSEGQAKRLYEGGIRTPEDLERLHHEDGNDWKQHFPKLATSSLGLGAVAGLLRARQGSSEETIVTEEAPPAEAITEEETPTAPVSGAKAILLPAADGSQSGRIAYEYPEGEGIDSPARYYSPREDHLIAIEGERDGKRSVSYLPAIAPRFQRAERKEIPLSPVASATITVPIPTPSEERVAPEPTKAPPEVEKHSLAIDSPIPAPSTDSASDKAVTPALFTSPFTPILDDETPEEEAPASEEIEATEEVETTPIAEETIAEETTEEVAQAIKPVIEEPIEPEIETASANSTPTEPVEDSVEEREEAPVEKQAPWRWLLDVEGIRSERQAQEFYEAGAKTPADIEGLDLNDQEGVRAKFPTLPAAALAGGGLIAGLRKIFAITPPDDENQEGDTSGIASSSDEVSTTQEQSQTYWVDSLTRALIDSSENSNKPISGVPGMEQPSDESSSPLVFSKSPESARASLGKIAEPPEDRQSLLRMSLAWFFGCHGEKEELSGLSEHEVALASDLEKLAAKYPGYAAGSTAESEVAWLDQDLTDDGIIAFIRSSKGAPPTIFIANISEDYHSGYQLGVPASGYYDELLNSDSYFYGGKNQGNNGGVTTIPTPDGNFPHALSIVVPAHSAIVLKCLS